MASFAERLAVAKAEGRRNLDPDERVVAIGRCADITELADIEQAGRARTFVMIIALLLIAGIPLPCPRVEERLDGYRRGKRRLSRDER
jgi:hypothetical protein